MLKHLFALSLFPAIFLFNSPAPGQSNPPQAPIACEVKNNVEDGACQNKLKGLFTRKGDTLTLKLDGGRSKTHTSATELLRWRKCRRFQVPSRAASLKT
jgi:hypothetical protein